MVAAALVTGCVFGTAFAAGAGTVVGEAGRPGVASTYPPEPSEPPPAPTPPPGGKLPFTGAQVLGMSAVGGGLALVGVLLLVASRRRHRADAE